MLCLKSISQSTVAVSVRYIGCLFTHVGLAPRWFPAGAPDHQPAVLSPTSPAAVPSQELWHTLRTSDQKERSGCTQGVYRTKGHYSLRFTLTNIIGPTQPARSSSDEFKEVSLFGNERSLPFHKMPIYNTTGLFEFYSYITLDVERTWNQNKKAWYGW